MARNTMARQAGDCFVAALLAMTYWGCVALL
jgi:hypothetical protein